MQNMIAKIDFRREGGISYSDFLIASMDFAKLLSSQKMNKLFSLIDKDGDGYISIKDLHLFTGKELPMENCHSIIRECLLLINEKHQEQGVNGGDAFNI